MLAVPEGAGRRVPCAPPRDAREGFEHLVIVEGGKNSSHPGHPRTSLDLET